MSDQAILLSKGQFDNSYTFWNMPILILSTGANFGHHPLCIRCKRRLHRTMGWNIIQFIFSCTFSSDIREGHTQKKSPTVFWKSGIFFQTFEAIPAKLCVVDRQDFQTKSLLLFHVKQGKAILQPRMLFLLNRVTPSEIISTLSRSPSTQKTSHFKNGECTWNFCYLKKLFTCMEPFYKKVL